MQASILIMFSLGLALLIGGAELLVRGASRLATSFGISPLVVGLTVVAFGTSSPELAISLASSFAGQGDLVVGNVVGSNIINVLLILGVAAAISPLLVAAQLVRIEVPLVIGAGVLVYVLGRDGAYGRADGLLLFAGAITYTVFVIRQSRKETRAVQEEYAEAFDGRAQVGRSSVLLQVGLIVAGLVALIVGSRWLLDSAVAIARGLNVSELVIGLTIVALGTSAPELATSILAALRGERDIAVGNVVGSNLFNLLGVLGLTAAISPQGVAIPAAALTLDIPFMIATSIACLPIFFTGYRIARWEGFLFLGYYVAYTLYLILAATQHDALPRFSLVFFELIAPLTVVTLGVLAVRVIRTNSHTA